MILPTPWMSFAHRTRCWLRGELAAIRCVGLSEAQEKQAEARDTAGRRIGPFKNIFKDNGFVAF